MPPQTVQLLIGLGANIVSNVIIPEITALQRAHRAANEGNEPTDTELIRAFMSKANAAIADTKAQLAKLELEK